MADRPVKVVAAACDGACSGNPGPGGWGALLRFEDGSVQELGGADKATTNNRMELTAALALLECLKELPRDPALVIRTDSRYLIDGFEKWLPGWKRKGWRTASGGAVLNRDLWEQLDRARLAGLRLQHVRGHSGDPDNDRCDAIAVAFSRGQLPALAAGDPAVNPATTATTATKANPEPDAAPPALQQLLSRLELADRLATGGYTLTAVELARLVELPLRGLEGRSDAWIWRDWRVCPAGEGRWRLERQADAGGLGTDA
jgi:ribonuclease HI